VIGDEILSGRTHDKNIAQVASWLNVQGIRLREVRVVPDVEAAIVEAVNILRARNDYLFTTGGIGPTHDDITVEAVAAALGVEVVIHPDARAILENYYATRGGLTPARLRMARVPAGARLIENALSGAPGITVENIFVLAGVPHIAAEMLAALTGTLEGGLPVLGHGRLLGRRKRDRRPPAHHGKDPCGLPDRLLPVLPRRPRGRQLRDPLDRPGRARHMRRRAHRRSEDAGP
jgi:molybdenum cofactor synthesis domain-containing protein